MRNVIFLIVLLFLFIGCDSNSGGDADWTDVIDTTGLDWEAFNITDKGDPCLFTKESDDSITIVVIEDCFIDESMLYTVYEDLQTPKRRLITIGSARKTTADTSMTFYLDVIPHKINYDKYSPNNKEE